MELIDQKDVVIGWTEKKDDSGNFVLERFAVFSYDFSPSKVSYLSSFQCTYGNVYLHWKDLNNIELFGEVFRIFASLNFKTKKQKKEILFCLGQIKQLKELRHQLRVLYDNDLLQEEFDEKYYNISSE